MPQMVEASPGEGLGIFLCYCRPVQLQCTALAILDSYFWLLSTGTLKLKLVYINAAYCIDMGILSFLRNMKPGLCAWDNTELK